MYQFEAASIDHPDRCEDALVATAHDGKALLAAVIDGMGGHQHRGSDGTLVTGREAAQVVRQTLEMDLAHLPADIDAGVGGAAETLLRAALDRANQRVMHELNNDGSMPMSRRVGAVATVALVCENGRRLLMAQIGDTRGYLYADGLRQLGEDDDNIGYMINLGVIDEDAGRQIAELIDTYDGINEPQPEGMIRVGTMLYDLNHAWRWFVEGSRVLGIPPANAVMNALGIDSLDPIPQIVRVPIPAGSTLLLCSDGVYKNLTTGEITAHAQAGGDVATAIGEAAFARSKDPRNGRSSPDDITVVAAHFPA